VKGASVPTVSVVIACYRYGKYVTDCVNTVLANTEVDLDILVVDDASPDDSWSVVRRLPRLDARIRVHRNEENRGLIATANAAVLAAPGDYVVLLSADDAHTPGWLDRGVSFLERNPEAVLAYGPTRRFAGAIPTTRVRRQVRPVGHAGWDWLGLACDRGVTPLLSPEAIVRTSAQRAVGGYRAELPYSSDMEMWLRLASIGDVLRIGGPVAAFYRVSPHSMSRGVYGDMLNELKVRRDAFDVWYAFADGRVPDRDLLMARARRALARRAVRIAYVAFLQDPLSGQFDSLCEFALDNDPVLAGPPVERLRALWDRRWAVSLRQRMLPVTRMGVRARYAAADIRARLHVI
jgi:glycosyltransferase involved in cell wall biosynthesis